MTAIDALFERAKKGILFKPETKKRIGPVIESLQNEDGFNRLIKLLEILNDLATAEDYELLNIDGFAFETAPEDSAKIDIIFKHINSNFKRSIPLAEIAGQLFDPVLKKTISDLLLETKDIGKVEIVQCATTT